MYRIHSIGEGTTPFDHSTMFESRYYDLVELARDTYCDGDEDVLHDRFAMHTEMEGTADVFISEVVREVKHSKNTLVYEDTERETVRIAPYPTPDVMTLEQGDIHILFDDMMHHGIDDPDRVTLTLRGHPICIVEVGYWEGINSIPPRIQYHW